MTCLNRAKVALKFWLLDGLDGLDGCLNRAKVALKFFFRNFRNQYSHYV